MSTWKIVLWLILFFPLGLYFMWKYSNWNAIVKYGLSAFFALVLLDMLITQSIGALLLFCGLGLLFYAIASFKSSTRKHKWIYFVSAFILFIVGTGLMPTSELEQDTATVADVKSEQSSSSDSTSSEASSELPKTKTPEQKKAEKEEQKTKQEAKVALEKATDAVLLAEATPTRENYDKANTLVVALTNEDQGLASRLGTVKTTVETQEATVAKQAEEKRLAAEKAESDRIAAEAAESSRIVEEQKVAAAEAQQKQEQEAAAAAAAAPPVQEEAPHDDVSQTVYVTTYGKKYHSSSTCRGLNASNSTQPTTLDNAISSGYQPCSICW